MKITKDYLKRLIKEELEEAIGDNYPDQEKVFLKVNLSSWRKKVGEDVKDYYIEIPTIFLQDKSFESSSQAVVVTRGVSRRITGYNGLSKEGKDYFDKFEDGKFKRLAIDPTNGGLVWKVVREDELPVIIRI